MIDERDDSEVHDLEDAYTLLSELGRGGSAIVYRARDRALHREVAIKVVRPRHGMSDEEALARLAREARTVARLQHPNIVTVYAVSRLRGGGLALVMQLIPGRTLKQAIADDGPFDAERAERVLKDVAEALAYAHANGVVHRDVKPENIFLDSGTGRALLSDFGIAHSTEFDSRLTMDGAAIGTPSYMAPEQIDGAPPNARSDLYSLGLVAWEMLSGERPWEGEALYSVIFKQKNEELPAIDELRPGVVPPRLQYIIERMLQKRASARWAGADGLLSALNHWVVPSDWRQWEESHRRRRDALKSAPKTKQVLRDATGAATVRFARPTDGPVQASGPASVVGASRTVAAVASESEPEDDAPSWATVKAPSSRLKLWSMLGVAVMLGGGVATYSQRALLFPTHNRPVVTLADSRAVEVHVVAPSINDSTQTANGTLGERTDSLRLDSVARSTMSQRSGDSVRADSITNTLLRRAARRAARAALGAIGPNAAAPSVIPPISAPTAMETPRPDAVRATDDPGVIAAGGRHSCALVAGRVQCWGANERGQLGDGDVESRDVPGPIVGDLTFVSVTTGLAHTCGVVRGGDAYCWGLDDKGQLGDATTTSRSAAVRVSGNLSFRVLRAGLSHTCGLTTGGDVACWGANSSGQLGDGSTSMRSSPVVMSAGVRFVSVTAGWNHSCGIVSDGTARCWGANVGGQLGNGARVDAHTAAVVSGDLKFTSIAAGGTHTCAVTDTGEAYCWGRNNAGQLGVGGMTDQSVPTRVNTSIRFASVTVGGVHSCARTRGGQVWCWGRNVYGQLGDGSNSDRDIPTRVVGGTAFASISATGAHTCGTAVDGETLCWGFNVEGQLGDGTRNHHARPTRVTLVGR